MDVDAFVAAHRGEWQRLDELVQRRRKLSGDEVDELVDLYQRAGTHLSALRSSTTDPALIGRLSSRVARARSAVTGAHTPAWRDAARLFVVTFPAAAYRARWWWLATALAFLVVSVAFGAWVAANPEVRTTVAAPEQIRQLVRHDFANYYSEHPAASFATQVWINNAWVSAVALTGGILLGVPTVGMLLLNAVNVGVSGGLMVAYGRADIFFGLILPHGLLELTGVFLAGAVGLRLGWTVIDPGPRRRRDALAAEGRAAMSIALGLVAVLLVSGVIEAFVTPSGLPTVARIAIGIAAEVAFVAYIILLGRRAVRGDEIGDLPLGERPSVAPTAA